MILTGSMIAAAAGYVVNEIKKSKGAQQASDELSTAIWEWMRPLFLKDDETLTQKIEEDPDKYQGALELAIEKKAQNDTEFSKQLYELLEKAKKGSKLRIDGLEAKGDVDVDAKMKDSKATIQNLKSKKGKIDINIDLS